jgi:hypothetical protein
MNCWEISKPGAQIGLPLLKASEHRKGGERNKGSGKSKTTFTPELGSRVTMRRASASAAGRSAAA